MSEEQEVADLDDEVEDEEQEREDVSLGFAVDRSDESWALLRNHFPSKLGGAPAWLDPVQLPTELQLRCPKSGEPLRFLLQLYAPINEDNPRAFHRSLFLFISPKGSSLGNPGMVRAFRSQLPRANEHHPFEPAEPEELPTPLASGPAKIAARRLGDASSADEGWYDEHELVVEPEPDAAEGAVADDPMVARLMAEYKAKMETAAAEREGRDADEPVDLSAFAPPDEELADFSSFTARLACAPEQCIRYTYAKAATALWSSRNRRPPADAPPPCERCGSARRFEFQVMPQALSFMGIDSSQKEAPDWATIAVYTCSASCAPTPPAAEGGQLADPASAAAADALAAVGHVAMLDGLASKPELNGMECTVLGWQADSGRWAVECADGAKIRVRSANLRLKRAGDAGPERDGGYVEEYVWVQTHEAEPASRPEADAE